MKTEMQNELLETLAQLSQRYPNWRFGQLVANVAGWANVEIWDVENDRLLAAAQAHLQDLARREQEACV